MKKLSALFVFVIATNLLYGQLRKVEKVVDSIILKANFNGTILIAKNGKKEYLRYTGLADRTNSINFSAKSRFKIFSITKTFTAVLIMQLYENGKLHLDSTIAKYYPEYQGEGADKITIRNLLTYSGGREQKDISFLAEAYNTTIWPVDTFIQRYCSGALLETPGTKFNYNNGDYIILGRIIEKIYGKSYQAVLQQQIIDPLKMDNTNYLHHEDIVTGMSNAYFNKEASITDFYTPTNYYIDNYFSSGAMYSTAEDLLIFDQALFNHRLLKKETVHLMLTAYPHLGEVAFGFWVYEKKFGNVNTLFAERQGYGYGFNSNWVHLIDKGVTLIILSNTNTVDLNKMREKIITAYLGQ
ncbi:serine hydrolase domain-containing protein [Gynurincola endophyticus]|uniref:serine hydrolase domain-containing protein n=1 Tax=Gynurincola endophyticus TaxID=2479004 RepID=UPI000F8C8C08|nr:serine hydrolase domain-containing protein [Gynurincola endophyticus]